MALDERLKRELERAARPADPSGVYEHMIRRRERRRIARKVQSGVLVLAVIAGSIAGVYGLSRVFAPGGSTSGDQPSPVPIVPHENGLIAFSGSTSDGLELRTVLADGSGREVIPTPPGMPWLHAWSPDGTRIAVSIFPNGEGDRAIWVMNADGSDPVQAAAAENVSVPSWSPDGTTIAYSAKVDGRTEIHLVSADGNDDRIVHAEGAEGTFAVFSAKFSPDGTEILFDRGTDSGFDIFVMNVDGTDVRRLTTTGTDYDPHWSPDGTRIAFTRQEIVEVDNQARATSDIFVMNADGTDVRRLTDGGSNATNLYPEWSPDGTKIAYVGGVTGGPGSLVLMNADGSNEVTLVEGEVLGISWQPLPATGIPVEPSPTPSPSDAGQDIGLGFPVCNVSSIRADLAARGDAGIAYVATRVGDVGECPAPEDAFNVIAVDLDGDAHADTSYGPIECTFECRTFSAPDLDGDGTAELLIVQTGGSVLGLGLFDIQLEETRPVVEPVTVAPPGDPAGDFDPGETVQLWLGGDEFFLYSLQCGDPEMRDGPGLIFTAAESRPHDSPEAEWQAHRITFALRDGSLEVVDVGDFTEPAGVDPPSFRSGETLCDSNLGP